MGGMTYYCKICKKNFSNFKEALRHAIETHKDSLGREEIERYKKALERSWSCEDCVHCGNIYLDDADRLKKACPTGYFFDHPNPAEGCPNFFPREDKW